MTLARLRDVAMNTTTPLSTHSLASWTFYGVALAVCFSALPATPLALGVAASAAVIFVAVDVKFKENLRGWLGISYFACALAYVVTIAFVMMQLYPPTASPKPPMPFWSFLYQLVTGGLLRDIFQEFGTAIAMIATYSMTIMTCTFLSTTIAMLTLRRIRASKWLLLLNTPGILLSVYYIATIAFDRSLAR
jgi:hypothetical protein